MRFLWVSFSLCTFVQECWNSVIPASDPFAASWKDNSLFYPWSWRAQGGPYLQASPSLGSPSDECVSKPLLQELSVFHLPPTILGCQPTARLRVITLLEMWVSCFLHSLLPLLLPSFLPSLWCPFLPSSFRENWYRWAPVAIKSGDMQCGILGAVDDRVLVSAAKCSPCPELSILQLMQFLTNSSSAFWCLWLSVQGSRKGHFWKWIVLEKKFLRLTK